MSTNYPVIRLTNGSNVYYCRTFNWNSTGVSRGNQPDDVDFTLPAGLPVATYSLVVTANGIASDPVSFTPVPYLTSALSAPATCSNVSFSYSPAVAPASATFTWTRAAVAGISNPAVVVPQSSNPSETLINTTAGPITVVYEFVLTSNGCSNTQQVTVVVNPSPTPVITGNAPVCAGNPIILNAGPGYSSYNWSTSASSQTITVTTAGTYAVTVTDGNGCTGSTSVVTTTPVYTITAGAVSNGSLTPAGVTNINCGNNMSYAIAADPGYVISDVVVDGVSQGAISTYPFNNVTANHTISATFATGCAVTGSGTTTPVSCFGGTNGTASITLTGSGSGAPGTYTVDGGSPVSYNSNPFSIAGLTAGNHTIIATVTAGGCTSSLIGITVGGPVQLTGTGTTTPTTCGNGGNGTATITLSSGTSGTYTVDGGAPIAYSTNPFTATGLTAGPHTIVATSAAGCVSADIVVNVGGSATFTATMTKTNLSACNNTQDGTITITPQGGTAPYTYTWSGETGSNHTPFTAGNVSSLTGLNYGYYNVTITDAGGCGIVTFTNIHIEIGYLVYVTYSGTVSSPCSPTGSIILYGNAGLVPYTYSLTGLPGSYQSSNTFTGLAAGPYTAYVKDNGGCVSTKQITVGSSAPLVISPFVRAATSCSADGSVQIFRTGGYGPYTYSLVPGTSSPAGTYGSNNLFTGLAAGPYTAYVKDGGLCISSANVTVAQGAALTVSISKINTSTCVADGSIQAIPGGGTAPYQYSIDGGTTFQANSGFGGLAQGNYTITVKDSKGCTGQASATIFLNPIVVTASATNATTCTSNNGKIQLFRTGGYGPFQYSIDGNNYQSSNTFTNVPAGTYSGFVRDSKTCIGSLNGIVVGPTGCVNTFAGNIGGSVLGKGQQSVTEKTVLTVQAYPNPSNTEFILMLQGYDSKEKVFITVTDLLGRKVFQTDGSGKMQYKFGNNFMPGMYNIQVIQGDEKRSLKLVKE
jgi:hypothetical protein